MASSARHKLRSAALVLLVWTALGLFLLSQGLAQKYASHEPTPWWHYLISYLVSVYIFAAFTPVLLWLGRRFAIERGNWLRRSAIHLLLSIIFSVAELSIHTGIDYGLGLFPTYMRSVGGTFAFLTIIAFHQNVLTYWMILGVQYAISYYQRYRERQQEALRLELHASELNAQLVNAQLSALKMQLHPHFLFNTLNAIMVLVRRQRASQAEEMLARLSDLLRLILEEVDTQEVPLHRELEYLKIYLGIEQVRFADRLRVKISADPAILNAAVPHLVLQPIVENAIRHGIGRSSSAGEIQIIASRVSGTLEIKIADDGPGFPPPESANGDGIGLANTRARLQQLYGDSAQLLAANSPVGGAIVTITLPYHLAQADSHADVMELHAVNDLAGG